MFLDNTYGFIDSPSFCDGLFSGQINGDINLTNELCNRAQNLGNCLGFPFIPQISIDKTEIHITLRFPVIRDTEDIYEQMKSLAYKASGSRIYSPTRSLLHGATTTKGRHEDLEPSRNPKNKKALKIKTIMHIQCRKQSRRFSPKVQPTLPGQFSAFWPINSKTKLPPALHTCRQIHLNWVSEKPVDSFSIPQSYLEAIFALDLNVNRALVHHPFLTQPNLSDEQIALAFFPNPKIKPSTSDNFCDPKLPQEAIIQSLKNTIHVQMSVLYADLQRALTEIPNFPLCKPPAATWQQACSEVKLVFIEINRHLEVDNAPKNARDLEFPLRMAIRNHRLRNHSLKKENSYRHPAFDNEAMSFGGIIRQGSKGKSIPNAALIVYPKNNRFIRIELRLNGHEGLCYDMPKKQSKRIITSHPEDIINIILRVCLYSQQTFDRILSKMSGIRTPSHEDLAVFCRRVRESVTKRAEYSIIEQIISWIQSGFCLDMALIDSPDMNNMLRTLTRKGFFIRKGSTSSPRYFPNIN